MNEKGQVCFFRALYLCSESSGPCVSFASSDSLVGLYADLLGRVEQVVRALLPSALPDGVGVLPSSPSPRHRRRAAENSMGGRAGYQEE